MTKPPSWEPLIGAPDMRFFPNRLDLGWTSSRHYGSIMILVRYEGTSAWYQHVFPAHAGDGTICPDRLEHLAGPLKELALRAPKGTQTMELYAAPMGLEFPEAMILLTKNRPENPMRHMCKIGSIPIKHTLFAEQPRRQPTSVVPEDRDIKEHSFPKAAPIRKTETVRPNKDANNSNMREPDNEILTGLGRLLAWVGRIDIPWPKSKPKTEQLTNNETKNGNNHRNERTTIMNEPTEPTATTPPPKPAPPAKYTCLLTGNTLNLSGLPDGTTEISLRVILATEEMNSPVCDLYQAIKQGAGLKVVDGKVAIENLFWRMGRFFAGHPATDKNYLLRVTPETDLMVLDHQDLPITGAELAEFVKGSLAGEGAKTDAAGKIEPEPGKPIGTDKPEGSGKAADAKPYPDADKLAEFMAKNQLAWEKALKDAQTANATNQEMARQLAQASQALAAATAAQQKQPSLPRINLPPQVAPETEDLGKKKASGWNKPVSGKVVWSVMAVLIALAAGLVLWSQRDKGVDVTMDPLDDIAARKQRALSKMLGNTNRPSQHVPKFKGVMTIPPQASAADVAEDERAILARGLSSQERAVFDQAMMLLKEIDLQKRASVPISSSVTNNGNGNSGNANGNNNTGNGVQFIYAPVINPVQTNVIVAPRQPDQSRTAKDSGCTAHSACKGQKSCTNDDAPPLDGFRRAADGSWFKEVVLRAGDKCEYESPTDYYIDARVTAIESEVTVLALDNDGCYLPPQKSKAVKNFHGLPEGSRGYKINVHSDATDTVEVRFTLRKK